MLLRPNQNARPTNPAIMPTPSGTPTPMPILAPVDRPPPSSASLLPELDAAVVCAGLSTGPVGEDVEVRVRDVLSNVVKSPKPEMSVSN